METTQEKIFEILDVGNSQHRLTVTPSRITITLRKDTLCDERDEVISFFIAVSQDEDMQNCECSFRGSATVTGTGKLHIIMHDGSHGRSTMNYHYYYDSFNKKLDDSLLFKNKKARIAA